MNSLIKYPKLNAILVLFVICFIILFSKNKTERISNYGCYMSGKIKKVKISGVLEKNT